MNIKKEEEEEEGGKIIRSIDLKKKNKREKYISKVKIENRWET